MGCAPPPPPPIDATTNIFPISQGEVQASNLIKPSNIVTVDGESAYGGQATLYCSGIGKPAPRITWNKVCRVFYKGVMSWNLFGNLSAYSNHFLSSSTEKGVE